MPPNSALRNFLLRLRNAAKMNPGVPIRRELKNGLRVDMKYESDTLHLQLSREGVPPSMKEWETVLAHLGAEYQKPDRCFIRGKIE